MNDQLNSFFQTIRIPETTLQIGTLQKVITIKYGDDFDFTKFIEENSNLNLYFLSGIREGIEERASDKDVAIRNYLAFDFDIRHPKKTNEPEPDKTELNDDQVKDIALEILMRLKNNPNFKDYFAAVFSGNGLHVYMTGPPIIITNPEIFKAGMERLIREISLVAGHKADGVCKNTSRIMRIPTSYNQRDDRHVQSEFIEFNPEATSNLLDNLMDIGIKELEAKASLEIIDSVKKYGNHTSSSNNVFEAINEIPIAEIVCNEMNWEMIGKGHFCEHGSTKAKACFIHRGANCLIHGGSDWLEPTQTGFSPFAFIKTIRKCGNKEVFDYFNEHYSHIKELSDKAKAEYKSETKIDSECQIELKESGRSAIANNKFDLSCLPENTIISQFIKIYQQTTDAPDEFLLTAALMTVATILTNETSLTFGSQDIRPHLWAILIAPSSRFRKTTVINIAKKLITSIDPNLLFSDENTPEAFIEHLAQNPCGLFTFSEISSFIKQFGKKYMSGFQETLTALYDSPELYNRIKKDGKGNLQNFEIKQPALNIFTASTIDWLVQSCSEGDMASGFLPRFLICSCDQQNKETMIFPQSVSEDEKTLIKSALTTINTNYKGKKELSPEAKDYYIQWAKKINKSMDQENNSNIDAYYTRLGIMAIKLSIIIEATIWQRDLLNKVSENNEIFLADGSLPISSTISLEAMKTAIDIADYYKQACKQFVLTQFTSGRYAWEASKIEKIIKKQGGNISKRDLLRKLGMHTADLDKYLKSLADSGIIYVKDIKTEKNQPSTIVSLL